MQYTIHRQFAKDVKKYSSSELDEAIFIFMKNLASATSLRELENVKKLSGYKNYYRYRIGDYRIGFEVLEDGTILLSRFLHRKDIYSRFP